MANSTSYARTSEGVIGRIASNGELEYVTYIRFCGDRAEAISWSAKSSDAARGYDARAFRAVQNANRQRKFSVVERNRVAAWYAK